MTLSSDHITISSRVYVYGLFFMLWYNGIICDSIIKKQSVTKIVSQILNSTRRTPWSLFTRCGHDKRPLEPILE